MSKSRTQKGITLIALIITIIVLLILAVVAISAVQNDGIINYAKNARESYEAEQLKENTTLQNYLDKINEHYPNLENGGETPEQPGTPDDEEQTVTAPTSITILGNNAVEEGLTTTLVAYDQNNNSIPGNQLTWSATGYGSSSITIEDGVVTGESSTSSWITVTATSKINPEVSAQFEMVGVGPAILSIGISDGGMGTISTTSVSKGGTVNLSVGASTGGPIEWVCDEPIIWESADSTIASVARASFSEVSATVTGVNAGTTTITAKHPKRAGVAVTVTITVTE